jgi:hypothetical protein
MQSCAIDRGRLGFSLDLDQLSKSDSLDLADHNLVFRSVVELGRARRLVAGHRLGVLKTSAVL